MAGATIAVWASDERDPEPCASDYLSFDPNDPASIRAAQRALQRQLGLRYLPTLCNEPAPGLFSRLGAAIRALWPRPEPAAEPVPQTVLVPVD